MEGPASRLHYAGDNRIGSTYPDVPTGAAGQESKGTGQVKQHHHHGHAHKHAKKPAKHHHHHGKHHPVHQPPQPTALNGGKVVTTAKHPTHHKPRKLSAGDVACCSAEAVAASLRLTGRLVSAADVLALYAVTASHPDTGQSVWDALSAAADVGVAGVRPVRFAPVDLDDPAAVLLGLTVPGGPHTVAIGGDGCWLSWGRCYDPWWPGAVLEEAWAVTW